MWCGRECGDTWLEGQPSFSPLIQESTCFVVVTESVGTHIYSGNSQSFSPLIQESARSAMLPNVTKNVRTLSA